MRHRPQADATAKSTTCIEGFDTPVELRRHPSARRMTLRVSRTKRAVIVTVPMQCDLNDADQFLTRNIDWVRARIGSLPTPVPFSDGALMPLRGTYHCIRFTGKSSADRLDTTLVEQRSGSSICTGPELIVHGRLNHAGRHLRGWLIEQSRKDLDDRVHLHCARLGLKAKRIAIRDQSSRWGSCSTTGVLSFSWRLILAPPLILDYVAAHEVAHLAEMNHGPRFWALVRKTLPELHTAKEWLSTRGLDLHRYGET